MDLNELIISCEEQAAAFGDSLSGKRQAQLAELLKELQVLRKVGALNTTATYKHKEKGNLYEIVCVSQMKHPDSGEWVASVTYQDKITERVFTRTIISFVENFEIVED